MARVGTVILAVCAFFAVSGWCDEAQAEFPQHPWDAHRFFSNRSMQIGQSPLGKSLLPSWLGKRQETCVDSGYSPCEGLDFCCPAGDDCCIDDFCVESGGKCCGGFTCPSGWDCCVDGCIPTGSQCCDNGQYCTAGNTCVLYDGDMDCCTDVYCTAYVSGGVTISSTAAPVASTKHTTTIPITSKVTTTTSEITTVAPTQITVTQFEYYTYTITWWYISWYLTWSVQEASTRYTTTYETVTTTTLISVYASDSQAASESFESVSATLSFSTPAAATADAPGATSPSTTAASSTSTRLMAGGGDGGSGSGNGASNLRVGGESMIMACFMGIGAATAFLMVWL